MGMLNPEVWYPVSAVVVLNHYAIPGKACHYARSNVFEIAEDAIGRAFALSLISQVNGVTLHEKKILCLSVQLKSRGYRPGVLGAAGADRSFAG
jgi:hypothetical protein